MAGCACGGCNAFHSFEQGYGINTGAGSFVGHGVDLVATYTYKTYGSVQAGYGHFFVGDYVNDSLASLGGATDADWAYLQLLFNF